MQHQFHIQLKTFGGWGRPTPSAFSFDLTRAAAWKLAVKVGLQKYGKAEADGGKDSRPIAPRYSLVAKPAWVAKASVANAQGTALSLLEGAESLFNASPGLSFTDGKTDNAHAFKMPIVLAANESFSTRFLIHNVDGKNKEVKGHIWYFKIGIAGSGILFQVRDGKPEIARLSATWNRADESELRLLWALNTPTSIEQKRIDTLIKKLYFSFDSLSLENSTGRDAWKGELVHLTFIPEPRGALHIVLEGADATRIEFDDLIELREVINLWGDNSSVEVGSTGGAWLFQPLSVRFDVGSMEFGPYLTSTQLGTLQLSTTCFSTLNSQNQPFADVNFEIIDYEEPQLDENEVAEQTATPYTLKATFTTTDNRYCAWLYALNAHIENGDRSGATAPLFLDTDALPAPPSPLTPDLHVIKDLHVTWDEEGRRSVTLNLRDRDGRIGKSIDQFIGRIANLKVDGNDLMRGALIVRGRLDDARAMSQTTEAGPRRLSIDTSKACTSMELVLDEGYQVLSETLCDPPLIGDGLRLGKQIRRLLRRGGFTVAEISNVPENLGTLLPQAAAGEDWATVTDASDSLESAIFGLLDRFGYGLRFYRDRFGIWTLEPLPTTIIGSYSSKQNGTRNVLLDGLTWERDHSGFHNIFKVIGGQDGHEITREYVDRHSMTTAANNIAHSRWVGRAIPYPTLRDSGLRTEADVNYALRSLQWRYGRLGRLATAVTYARFDLKPLDRFLWDGILCELIGAQANASDDRIQLTVREVL